MMTELAYNWCKKETQGCYVTQFEINQDSRLIVVPDSQFSVTWAGVNPQAQITALLLKTRAEELTRLWRHTAVPSLWKKNPQSYLFPPKKLS